MNKEVTDGTKTELNKNLDDIRLADLSPPIIMNRKIK
jgi:hypothetical protein